ncbi:hypothetical protein [Methylobacterium nigriterrae]|uniref:hypothetical protein n=1 Tax=Methylobacterium nigriterrae TaxID=3127512 RepID=UPI003013BCBE
MAPNETIDELLRQGSLTQLDVDAAVDAAAADPSVGRLNVGAAHALNMIAFLRSHSFVAKTLRDPEASEGLKKAALRKVILKARVEKR